MTIEREIPNTELLKELVEWVEHQDSLPVEDPERKWNQHAWAAIKEELIQYTQDSGYLGRIVLEIKEESRDPNVCGTAYCVAGKVVVDAGYKFLFDDYDGMATMAVPKDVTVLYNEDGVTVGYDERMRLNALAFASTVDEIARDLLGISKDEAQQLFAASNTSSDIRMVAERIAGKEL